MSEMELLRAIARLEAEVDRLKTMEFAKRYILSRNVADNIATGVFSITTTNETGDTDGGGYAVFVHALIGHGLSSTTTDAAAKSFSAQFCRVMVAAGTGVNSAVSEVVETASAATTGATRDIGAVTMTVVENSEYVQYVAFQVDGSGSDVTTLRVICDVYLVWYGFTTPPTLAAL